MFRALGRTAMVAVLLGAVLAGGGAAAARNLTASCSTHGLTAAGGAKAGRIVALSVDGLSCQTGRLIAREIAGELARGEDISLANASGYSMSELSSCTSRCTSMTEISISYPRGSVRVSIGGAASGGVSAPGRSVESGPGFLTA